MLHLNIKNKIPSITNSAIEYLILFILRVIFTASKPTSTFPLAAAIFFWLNCLNKYERKHKIYHIVPFLCLYLLK